MKKVKDFQDLAFAMFNETARRGLMYHSAEDEALDGRLITVNGTPWINFGSCSYLGLELEPALKEGVIDAVSRYGTQFSSSRAMVSAPPYAELEAMLGEIFDAVPLISSSTSLGHIGTIPMIVDEDDAIILDQQVHMSVETATRLARVNGTPIHIVRHNRLDQLEQKIVALGKHHRKVWYMADGLYSMYGDFAPLDGLMDLLARHEQLHLYFDDAHAMSWTGRHGRGFVLGRYPLHERMVVATSLNKAFACAGGVMLMRDAAMRQRIKTVGGPYIYSGPIQPPMLGAALASARLHLSPALTGFQAELAARIRLCNRLLTERGLPLISRDETPVRFVGTGLPGVTHAMVERLQHEGLYVNAATFPVVPMTRAGLRFTITRHHTEDDIARLVAAIAHHLPIALADEGSSLAAVRAAFELPEVPAEAPAERVSARPSVVEIGTRAMPLTLERHTAVADLDACEWDRLLGANGSFTVDGLAYLESTFQANALPEDNWRFFYYVVRDGDGTPVLATFFTEALWKDDMIAAPKVSRLVEETRRHERYFLTTRTFAMGSLLTEGEHLYLDRGRDWQAALALLLKAVKTDGERCGAPMIVFRDLAAGDQELEQFLLQQGFAKFLMPESLAIEADWQSEAEYVARLSLKSRRHLRLAVRPWDEAYDIEVLTRESQPLGDEAWDHLYGLYRNVQARGLEYNTFALPEAFLRKAMDHACWEIVVLRLKPAFGGPADQRPVAFMLAFVGPTQYAPLVAGLDYDYVASHGAYRQLIRQAIQRGRAHGRRSVLLGMGAAFEKRRFGATAAARAIFFQTDDAYPLELLAKMYADAKD